MHRLYEERHGLTAWRAHCWSLCILILLVSTFCSDYARFINEMQAMMTQFRLIVRLI